MWRKCKSLGKYGLRIALIIQVSLIRWQSIGDQIFQIFILGPFSMLCYGNHYTRWNYWQCSSRKSGGPFRPQSSSLLPGKSCFCPPKKAIFLFKFLLREKRRLKWLKTTTKLVQKLRTPGGNLKAFILPIGTSQRQTHLHCLLIQATSAPNVIIGSCRRDKNASKKAQIAARLQRAQTNASALPTTTAKTVGYQMQFGLERCQGSNERTGGWGLTCVA